MINLKFSVTISYKDFDNEYKKEQYTLFARDKAHAIQISKELFFVSTGILPEMRISVRTIKAKDIDRSRILEYINTVLPQIQEAMNGGNYSQFIKNYTLYEGKNLVFKEIKSYELTTFNITFRYTFKDNACNVETDMLIVYMNNTKYIVMNMQDVYFGG